MRGRLALLAAVFLSMAACEQPAGDPNPVATPGLRDTPTEEIQGQPTDAAKSQQTVVATPVATPRVTDTPTPSPTRALHPKSTRSATPCYPAGFFYPLHWLSDHFVRWSPDGDHVLFTQGAGLYAVTADRARVREVARGSVEIPRDRWGAIGTMIAFDVSPDGKRVVYATCENPKQDLRKVIGEFGWWEATSRYGYELEAIGIDGTQSERLTKTTDFENYPSWSPDGERIAFLRTRGDPLSLANHAWLATMAADGSDQQTIVTGFDSLAMRPPAWSPDGTRLAFAGDDGESGLSIYTVRTDGTDLRKLTRTISGPSWSPDGERIAFAKADWGGIAVYTIAADGTDARRVTAIREDVRAPSWSSEAQIRTLEWSPDGSKILFIGNQGLAKRDCGWPTTDGIYVVGVDGSDLVRLGTSEPEVYLYAAAAWSPDGRRIAVLADVHSKYRFVFGCDHAEWAASGAPRPMILFMMTPKGADVRELAHAAEMGVVAVQSGDGGVTQPQVTCKNGYVVNEPEANVGLVRDCETLIRLRKALFGRSINNWGVGTPIDRWLGVTVEGSPLRVTGLTLGGDKRRLIRDGIIHPRLSELTELRVLDTSSNTVMGEIPAELGRLKKLEQLDLSDNRLNGEIPSALGQLSQLKRLELGGNRLAGPIPGELGQLAKLQVLDLSGNDLTGDIPPELGQLVELEVLVLSGNRLAGSVPRELGGLENLETLRLESNRLTGEIPVELGELADLKDSKVTSGLLQLGLGGNRFTGCIPKGLREDANTNVGALWLPDC